MILTALGVLAAVPAAAGLSGRAAIVNSGSTLKPPVITEDFKPVLACNPNTIVGMEGCGEHKVLSADKQLNADVTVIFGVLTRGAARQDFVLAESTWLTYRNADCRSQSDIYLGGTEQPIADVYCLATDDIARRQELKAWYKDLTQGLDKAPKFP